MESPDTNTTKSGKRNLADLETAQQSIEKSRFREWYRAREFRRNIRNGKPYFNDSGSVPPARQHSPSSLLQCHRKIYYRQKNAPEEKRDAQGILWTGKRIEEEIVVPFLQDVVATEQTYIRNSVWIDFTVETRCGELRIKGVTDPVVVDKESIPLLPTEIKTTSSIDFIDSPKPHHLAQLHAYIAGLTRKYEETITEGVLVYVSRESLELKSFQIEFDQEFWEETVVDWATTHSEHRLNDRLPQANPEHDWECKFCSYRERCGKGNGNYTDFGVKGFLPNYTEYPREKVVEHLESREQVRLTQTLADQYPELTKDYEVLSWECPRCSASYSADEEPFKEDVAERPLCPNCVADDTIVELRPPIPEQEK